MLVLETARYIIDDDQDESQVSTDNKSQDDLREETLTTKSMIQLRLEGKNREDGHTPVPAISGFGLTIGTSISSADCVEEL